MPLTLYVDGPRWRTHLQAVRDAHPGIVPVVKGNGYGLGVERLAARAAWLGVDTVAVGMYHEVTPVAAAFRGTVMVLSPWRPFETHVVFDSHVVHTVGRLEDLRAIAERGAASGAKPRVVLERLTSMRRHGFSARDLRGITGTLDPDDSHVGLIQFKVGTGGEAVEYAGEWDLPINRAVYKAFDLYMSRRG